MATRTASVSGDWSSTATWGGAAVPVSGDTFTINAGIVVDFDVDQSGMASGMGASTVNGTLRAKRAAGTYYLKMAGNLTVSTTGTLDASDGSGGAYRSDATFTILLNGNFTISVTGSGLVNLICGEPAHLYVRLSQAESASTTTLHVDTDVTAETLWASGALVRIDNINAGVDSEERTISGSPASTSISITAGLTGSKLQGAFVSLVTRNVRVIGASTASGTGLTGPNAVSGASVIRAEIRGLGAGIANFRGVTIGGTITNLGNNGLSGIHGSAVSAVISAAANNDVSAGNGCSFSGLISAAVTGINNGVGHYLTGIIAGCTFGVANPQPFSAFNASVIGCGTGISGGGGVVLLGCTFTGSTQDLNQVASAQAVSTLLNSSTEFLSYNSSSRAVFAYVESLDHDQAAGAFRSWTLGGITSSVATPVYDASRARSYKAVPESATYPVFFQRRVLVPAGGTLAVRCCVRKDASMAYLPRVWAFSAEKEPLVSGSPDAEVTMTNSVDTWEVLETSITNTGDSEKPYIVRMLAKNASGSVYFDPIIRVSSFVPQREIA